MDQASDFERVLSVLAEDLKGVGLSFETCGIDVLDEPVDEPTMAYFEDRGFRYASYTIDGDGVVTRASYHVSAPFPRIPSGGGLGQGAQGHGVGAFDHEAVCRASGRVDWCGE